MASSRVVDISDCIISRALPADSESEDSFCAVLCDDVFEAGSDNSAFDFVKEEVESFFSSSISSISEIPSYSQFKRIGLHSEMCRI